MEDRFKFRFYDNNKEIMIDENADYNTLKATYGQDEWWWCVEAGMPTVFKYFELQSWDGDKDFVIMQCTGLKDKNGKLIYEGDIVKHSKSNQQYKVQWNDKGFWQLDDYAMARSSKFLEENYEVIGNIYENKELLESEG